MAILISPGVAISEIDLTNIIPAVGTTTGAIAGIFQWGPAYVPVLLDSENTMVSVFGEPDINTATTWFTCASFLAYANALQTVRCVLTGMGGHLNSTADGTGLLILNRDDYTANYSLGQGSVGMFAGKYAGALGNSLAVSIADSSSFATWEYKSSFSGAPGTSDNVLQAGGSNDEIHVAVIDTLGIWSSGVPNTVLEVFPYCSKSSVAFTEAGTLMYYAEIVNRQSSYVWWMGQPSEDELGTNVACDWGGDNTVNYQTTSTKLTLDATTGEFTVGETVSDAAKVVVTSAGAGATATALASGPTVVAFVITDPGTGYISAPTVTVTGGTGTNDGAVATVSDGHLISITLTSPAGYTDGDIPVVTIVSPGSGATASTTVNANGQLTAVTVLTPGTGYTSVPTVTISGPGTGALVTAVLGTGETATQVVNYLVTNSGSNYSTVSGKVLSYAGSVLELIPTVGDFVVDQLVTGATSSAFGTVTQIEGGALYVPLTGGVDANASITDAEYITGYDYFQSPENITISLVLTGAASANLAQYIISNITEFRMDCIALLSPPQTAVVNNAGNEATDIVAFRNQLTSTSYAVMDSGWKYTYDVYNDVYRWVPLNGDIAGLCVATDVSNGPWWSPAGYNRGMIKNVVKLAYNPNQTDRDILYPAGIDPVISVPGQGTLLFGDKTMLSKPSAFDRINVRRLFIVLEVAISLAAKYTLFEFNDVFTQAQFVNMVEPYLRTIQGARGITAYDVICDSTNNTPQVIDANQFVGSIFIQPARSINFIQLNFVAVGTGVDFTTVVGLA